MAFRLANGYIGQCHWSVNRILPAQQLSQDPPRSPSFDGHPTSGVTREYSSNLHTSARTPRGDPSCFCHGIWIAAQSRSRICCRTVSIYRADAQSCKKGGASISDGDRRKVEPMPIACMALTRLDLLLLFLLVECPTKFMCMITSLFYQFKGASFKNDPFFLGAFTINSKSY
jgi:hypothetical protein